MSAHPTPWRVVQERRHGLVTAAVMVQDAFGRLVFELGELAVARDIVTGVNALHAAGRDAEIEAQIAPFLMEPVDAESGPVVAVAEVRAALQRAEANAQLHIERDVYDAVTAKAVAEEYATQFAPLLGAGVIDEARRALVKRYHPDGSEPDAVKFHAVGEAYRIAQELRGGKGGA